MFRYRESNPGLKRERLECYRYTISEFSAEIYFDRSVHKNEQNFRFASSQKPRHAAPKSSDRTFGSFVGEFWILPFVAVLVVLISFYCIFITW